MKLCLLTVIVKKMMNKTADANVNLFMTTIIFYVRCCEKSIRNVQHGMTHKTAKQELIIHCSLVVLTKTFFAHFIQKNGTSADAVFTLTPLPGSRTIVNQK